MKINLDEEFSRIMNNLENRAKQLLQTKEGLEEQLMFLELEIDSNDKEIKKLEKVMSKG